MSIDRARLKKRLAQLQANRKASAGATKGEGENADAFHRRRDELRERIRKIEEGGRMSRSPFPTDAADDRTSPAAEGDLADAISQGKPVSLDEILEGEVLTEENGVFYYSAFPAGELWGRAEIFRKPYDALWRQIDSYRESEEAGSFAAVASLLRGAPPERVAYLDLETTGLAGVPLFLVGVMTLEEDGFWLHQYVARDYTEEAPLLRRLERDLERTDILVTFNGKTFDIPFLKDRYTYHLLPWRPSWKHLDLLPHCRKRWRGVLPNCRLQTIESAVCGRDRVDDTPGSEIPGIYHEFVRTRNAAKLGGVFEHNQWDLVAMAEILTALSHEGWSWHSPDPPGD